MRRSKLLAYTSLAASCFLFGVITADQWSVMAYYFEPHTSDQVVFSLIAFSFYAIGVRFVKLVPKVSFLLIIFLLFMVLPGQSLAYHLYRHMEWAIVVIYAGLGITGIAVSHFSQNVKAIHAYSVFIFSFLAGFFVVTHIASFEPVYGALLFLLPFLLGFFTSKWFGDAIVGIIGMSITLMWFLFDPLPVQFFKSQEKYYDPVVYSRETPFQTIDITRWKGQDWFYYNQVNQFSSIDHWLYFEPMVHPIMHLTAKREKILVIGGENGMITKELLAYPGIENIDHLPIDTVLYEIAQENPYFTGLNNNALENEKVKLRTIPAFDFLHQHPGQFDLIFVDVPDPMDLELNQYYTREFYTLCYSALAERGLMITQAGSPYYASKAFYCIQRTMEKPGFSTVALHNQVLTLGEWGWILGSKDIPREKLKELLLGIDFVSPKTQWLNKDAMKMMLSFGKQLVELDTSVNSLKNPVVHRYYTLGTWKF